jgi:hypothetical protein
MMAPDAGPGGGHPEDGQHQMNDTNGHRARIAVPGADPRRAALWLTLATIVMGMGYSIVLAPLVRDFHGWWLPPDVWPPLTAARFVSHGAVGQLYSADPLFVASPFGALVLVPIAWIGRVFHLTDSELSPESYPSLWLVYGPLAFALSVSLFSATRSLLQELWSDLGLLATGRPPRHVWTQMAMVVLVICPAVVVYGHFEDLIALAFVMLGIRQLLRRQWTSAAVWFGLAVGFKQWALLGVPLLVALTPAGSRLRSLAWSLALPGSLMAMMLAMDWGHASQALFAPKAYTTLGHHALWIHPTLTPLVGSPYRALAFVAAFAIAWRLRGRTDPRIVIAGFALVFLSRMLFEPVVFSYYTCPGFALLLLHERARGRSGWRTFLLGTAIQVWFQIEPGPWLWWGVALAIMAVMSAPAVADLARRPLAVTVSGTGAVPATGGVEEGEPELQPA